MNEQPPPPAATPPPVSTPPPAALPPPLSNPKDERMWAMFCHLSALSGHIIPFGNIIGPLVIWMIKRDEYPLVADQGKEALNFQITVMILFLVSIPLIFVCGVGIATAIAAALFNLIFIIVASVKANEGAKYRYPLTIRFIK